ncbi:MAG: nucleotidyltransferase domain-containing protein [Ardenticatenaceae bacterium]|nr:nucleotidyltransferase domain-containing protein [Ardenticatenaceae bacterium]
MMTPATAVKREQLCLFIARELAGETAVKAVIGIGSIATGRMRPDSDIDAIIFLEPYNDYIVPAEAIWLPDDGSFHAIFSRDERVQRDGIQLDFARFDWAQWGKREFAWPEQRLAELSNGWVAYDPTGEVTAVIQARTVYPEALRIERLDEAVTWLDQHLEDGTPEEKWQSLGPLIAHDRLQAAYGWLVQGLFAINGRWRGWRNREMSGLLQLPWLPNDLEKRLLLAGNAPALDYAGYMARVAALRGLFADLLHRLQAEGFYGNDPIGEAFVRGAEEPGRAWNMATWNEQHQQRNS